MDDQTAQDTQTTTPETPTAETTQTAFDANAYNTIVETIKRVMGIIETTKTQVKDLRESLDSILKNDSTYQTHLEAANTANKLKNKTKQEVLKRPEAAIVLAKMKDLSTTLKENQATLSENLVSYINIAGVNEIEDENGIPREITFTAKLKPMSQRE